MRIFWSIIVISIIISCSNAKNNSFKTFYEDGLIIKGNVIEDSVFNDTMFYYSKNDLLVAKKVFRQGKQSGISIEYHPNRNVAIVSNYSDGLKYGYYNVFDTSGILNYQGFYYYDLTVGPIIYFHKGKPKRYFFSDLNEEDILHIYYPDWEGVSVVYDKLINFSTNIIAVDTMQKVSVFLYLLAPPKLSFKYSVVRVRVDSETEVRKIRSLHSELPFISFSLPVIQDKREEYAIKLAIYDSILDKSTTIYKEFDDISD